jgi:hypothetical protein
MKTRRFRITGRASSREVNELRLNDPGSSPWKAPTRLSTKHSLRGWRSPKAFPSRMGLRAFSMAMAAWGRSPKAFPSRMGPPVTPAHLPSRSRSSPSKTHLAAQTEETLGAAGEA